MKYRCPAWPPDWPEVTRSVAEVVSSGDWGRYHSAIHEILRQKLRVGFGVESARLVSSGTAGIEIALRAAGVGPGDEVAVAAYDYLGNFRSIEQAGARPVLLDIEPRIFSISPSLVGVIESGSIKAVIASHLYGHAASISAIRDQCSHNNWVLIEDACQVPGLKINGKAAGSFGDLGVLSFGGSKPLTAGCGGAILTNNSRYDAKISSIVERPSDAFALSALQSAALVPQFEMIEHLNQQRALAARAVGESAERFPSWCVHHVEDDGIHPAYYKLAFTASSADQRARIVSSAEEFGLPIGEGFRAMHNSSPKRCRKPLDLSRSQQASECVFVLDHRALLIEPSRYDELIDSLAALHDATA